VVLLVIDQFRADYLTRFSGRFLPPSTSAGVGGFRYLMEQGAYYPLGEFEVLQNMTCVGHATFLTGSYPYQNGIPLNHWFERGDGTQPGRKHYCVEDPEHRIIGVAPDPKRRNGTSPRALVASTLGDELKNAGFRSRVVAIAGKDRSAILMAGRRADAALWWDTLTRQWVSSTFYFRDGKLPAWVRERNAWLAGQNPQALTEWKLGAERPSGLSLVDNLVDPARTHGLGKDFTHATPLANPASFSLPLGIEETAGLATAAVDAMGLGTGPEPDLLAVSFSSHDYLGHTYGPNSRELEEVTVLEDRVLAKFFNHLDRKVPGGLRNVTVVLTGDHGTPPNPDWLNQVGVEAGRIDEKALRERLEAHLVAAYGKPRQGESWVAEIIEANVYLNRAALSALERGKAVTRNEVEQRVKSFLLGLPEFAFVLTAGEMAAGAPPPGLHGRQALLTYFPARSGDLIAIPKPHFFVDPSDTCNHHTGYSYDRYVPLILAGPGIRPGKRPESAKITDLAPTLAFLVGVLPPNLSEGRVLSEALLPREGKTTNGVPKRR
jgi:predicted AlkP superfamily pyrophosphatase or phosphodiesterase